MKKKMKAFRSESFSILPSSNTFPSSFSRLPSLAWGLFAFVLPLTLTRGRLRLMFLRYYIRSNMDNLSVQKTREIVSSVRRLGGGPRQVKEEGKVPE
jgi:hypothetical protein